VANDTVLLDLEGVLTINELALAMRRFSDLMTAITLEVGGGRRVTWQISGLEYGSAQAQATGITTRPENLYYVERATRAYVSVGTALQTGEPIPFSKKVRRPAESLVGMLNGHIHTARFENAEAEVIVAPQALKAQPAELVTRAYGAIEGRVQTVSNRGVLHFTVYDSMNDRAISCYLQEGREEMLRDLWGQRATVEGYITRDANTGRPLTIRQITRINPLMPLFGSYRDALGASPWFLSKELPEDAMRKLRDAG
jgi:hypothetical protein